MQRRPYLSYLISGLDTHGTQAYYRFFSISGELTQAKIDVFNLQLLTVDELIKNF